MEWLGILIWLMVAGFGLGLALFGALSTPWLALQPLLTGAGLVCAVLYVVLEQEWLAWTSAGLGLLTAMTAVAGAAVVTSDAAGVTGAGQAAEEQAALLAGMQWPLATVVGLLMVLAAVGVTTVG